MLPPKIRAHSFHQNFTQGVFAQLWELLHISLLGETLLSTLTTNKLIYISKYNRVSLLNINYSSHTKHYLACVVSMVFIIMTPTGMPIKHTRINCNQFKILLCHTFLPINDIL
jgi:hypothetical protein